MIGNLGYSGTGKTEKEVVKSLFTRNLSWTMLVLYMEHCNDVEIQVHFTDATL